jgi:hypothetical protein
MLCRIFFACWLFLNDFWLRLNYLPLDVHFIQLTDFSIGQLVCEGKARVAYSFVQKVAVELLLIEQFLG